MESTLGAGSAKEAKRGIRATMAAAILAAGAIGYSPSATASRKSRRHVPTMVCSPQAEIDAWNADVEARSDHRTRIANRRYDRKLARQFADNGQRPKFAKPRVHKQHVHPLRDKHGAYTLTGGVYSYEGVAPTSRDHVISGGKDGNEPFFAARRKWLAGISAQRGY